MHEAFKEIAEINESGREIEDSLLEIRKRTGDGLREALNLM